MDLYQDLDERIFEEDFQTEFTYAKSIISKAMQGSVRDLIFCSILIDELKNYSYKGEYIKTKVLVWGDIPGPSNITPFGLINPEYKLSFSNYSVITKDGVYKMDQEKGEIYGIYSRLEQSIYMFKSDSIVPMKPYICYIKTQKGYFGWKIEEVNLPNSIFFALAEIQKRGYGAIIKNNLFYPNTQIMYYELPDNSPINYEKKKIFKRAKEFYKLAGNFTGKVIEYKIQDDNEFAPENTKLLISANNSLVITNLLSKILEMLKQKTSASFIIYPYQRDIWKIRESKYFQIGDRIISYTLLDNNKIKIDVHLSNVFYDIFLSKIYQYYVTKDKDNYLIL
jgi:hypothetical protein